MRVAVLADIHGNLPACEAVLADIRRQSPDIIVAAGDLALRGAHPREVVDLLTDTCHGLLMGNTDCYIAGNYLGGAYRQKDHWKVELLEWTRDQLGEARTKMLGQLPFSLRYSPRPGQDLFVCHANPKNLEDSIEPTMDEATLKKYLAGVDATAVAFGHLHFPYRRKVGRITIADVASVGIPRDGDMRSTWGLFTFTTKGWRVQIRRVRYPVRRATSALHERKVPGAPLLVHKMLEAKYRHHTVLAESARRHSGLPPQKPFLRPPPWAQGLKPAGSAAPLGAPPLPLPPGMPLPEPGQATQEDEAIDETIVPNLALQAPPDDDGPSASAPRPEADAGDEADADAAGDTSRASGTGN